MYTVLHVYRSQTQEDVHCLTRVSFSNSGRCTCLTRVSFSTQEDVHCLTRVSFSKMLEDVQLSYTCIVFRKWFSNAIADLYDSPPSVTKLTFLRLLTVRLSFFSIILKARKCTCLTRVSFSTPKMDVHVLHVYHSHPTKMYMSYTCIVFTERI
jgi:hypothetical protein